MFDVRPLQQSTSTLDTALTSANTTLLPLANYSNDLAIPLASSGLQPASLAPDALSSDTLSSGAISPASLISLGTLEGRQIQTGTISGNGSDTDYSFNLATPASLSLSLTGSGGDADLYLYRVSNGQLSFVKSSAKDGNSESLSVSGLAAGTYYAQVYEFGTSSTAYNLTLTSDTAGSSLSNARNLGSNSNGITTTVKDFVGTDDPQDFYGIQLTGTQNNLAINLGNLTADADVSLIWDANNNGTIDSGETIAASINGGTGSESINLQGLTAGNYYIKVFQYSGDTNFTLDVAATAFNTVPDLSSIAIPANPITVGTLQGRTSYSQTVNSFNNLDDFYRFDLTTTSQVDLALTGTGGDADLYLARDFNGDGRIDSSEIIRSSFSSSNQESISIPGLAAGTYYAIVDEAGTGTTTTNYTLTMTADAAGNNAKDARNLGILGSGTTTTVKDFVGTSDPQDFYRFQLTGIQNNLAINLKDLTADADVYLIRDANNNGIIDPGETIASSINAGTASESMNLQGLVAGNYFLEVMQYSGDTNFTLSVATTAFNAVPDLSLFTIPTNPITVGALQGRTSYSQSVNSVNNLDDFYRFDLTAATTKLDLSLTGTGGDADLYLARDFNGDGQIDRSELIQYVAIDGNQEAISLSGLTAGTYYAIVDEFGAGTTNYTLTMTADTAGNNLKDARNLGTISSGTTTTVNDFVGTSDPQDFYRVQLTGTSTDLLVNLKNLTGDADVWISQDTNNNGVLDSGDTTFGYSYNGGTTPDTIYAQGLAAGTYFISVVPVGNANTNYTLGVSALSSAAGDSLTAPIDLGTVATQRAVSGSLTSTDGMDFYHFNLGSTADLNLYLSGLTNTTDLYLFRDINNNGVLDAGDLVQRSLVANPTAGNLDLSGLAAGSYFVGVLRDGGNTNYNLTLTPNAAGNTLSTARNLGVLNGDRGVTDFLTPSQSDYYQFTLNTTSNVAINLGWLGGLSNGQTVGVDMTLIRDFNGNGIVESSDILRQAANNGVGDVPINITLAAGTYYLRLRDVDSANYNTNYKLNLTATPV